MRGGPNAGWKQMMTSLWQNVIKSLNEGWPECGMETELSARLTRQMSPCLNEGWPECGMET